MALGARIGGLGGGVALGILVSLSLGSGPVIPPSGGAGGGGAGGGVSFAGVTPGQVVVGSTLTDGGTGASSSIAVAVSGGTLTTIGPPDAGAGFQLANPDGGVPFVTITPTALTLGQGVSLNFTSTGSGTINASSSFMNFGGTNVATGGRFIGERGAGVGIDAFQISASGDAFSWDNSDTCQTFEYPSGTIYQTCALSLGTFQSGVLSNLANETDGGGLISLWQADAGAGGLNTGVLTLLPTTGVAADVATMSASTSIAAQVVVPGAGGINMTGGAATATKFTPSAASGSPGYQSSIGATVAFDTSNNCTLAEAGSAVDGGLQLQSSCPVVGADGGVAGQGSRALTITGGSNGLNTGGGTPSLGGATVPGNGQVTALYLATVTAGSPSGSFQVGVFDETTNGVCQTPSRLCTTAAPTGVFFFASDAGLLSSDGGKDCHVNAGDLLDVRISVSSCATTNPMVNIGGEVIY